MLDQEAIDEATRERAEERAQEGTQFAREAGFDAEARISEQASTTAEAILATADAIGASAILLGSRGLTGLKSALLGSVSNAVIHNADRTVIVVPSPGGRRRPRAPAGQRRWIAAPVGRCDVRRLRLLTEPRTGTHG